LLLECVSFIVFFSLLNIDDLTLCGVDKIEPHVRLATIDVLKPCKFCLLAIINVRVLSVGTHQQRP
jgi:hypothetical protein